MKYLLLTLGHNSSAILIEDGKLVWGYETERLSGQKSDSHFPQIVLDAKRAHKPDMVYVTHWAPSGQLSDMSAKHWNPAVFDGVPIRTLSPDRTHHDTHMAAAMLYAGPEFTTRKNLYGLVVDGFGTMGEHLSVYKFEHGVPHLVRRVHGYETSLGLWYQYATAFMGMKMHEDEYKLLGYEVHCPPDEVNRIESLADHHAAEILEKMERSIYGSKYDPVYDIGALASVKSMHFAHLTRVCETLKIDDPTSTDGRTRLARYVQRVLETVVIGVTREYFCDMDHLLCSGGCFLNVKLNCKLIDQVTGQLCVYPLAGDQGNALGLFAMDHPAFRMPDHLNWGVRDLKNLGSVDGLFYMDRDRAQEHVIMALQQRGYVNLVRGHMEFGPRALCNTSTLAMPTLPVVEKINAANDRNTVMPMAPVMTENMFRNLFYDTNKVWKSEEHMIVAMEYRVAPPADMQGIAHRYGEPYVHFTGRPQVVDQRDDFMVDILDYFGHPLINTSFNYHGKPIAFDTAEVIQNHRLQHGRDRSFNTIIIPN